MKRNQSLLTTSLLAAVMLAASLPAQGQHTKSFWERVFGTQPQKANMYNRHPKRACSDWGAHPIDCIREAYGNHLKGTNGTP